MNPTTETPEAAFNRQQLIPMLQYRRRRAEIHGDVETIAVIDLAIAEIERLREGLAASDAFIAYLKEADRMTAVFLMVHGWQYPPEFLARGDELRKTIAKLHAVGAEECEAELAMDNGRLEGRA